MPGKTVSYTVRTDNVPGDVNILAHLPECYDPEYTPPLPLLLLLHGGNGSERDLLRFVPAIDRAITDGMLPPLVVATPGARRSLYMDYVDGTQRWETFLLEEVLPFLRDQLHVSAARSGTFVGGWSMGGLGSLRLAFKNPAVFAGVAAIEPAIEPVLSWGEVGPHVKFWRSDDIYTTIFGSPVDEGHWQANHPSAIAKRDPKRLANLKIYLEVGDQDMLCLYEGAEFLHRILFDAGIPHEYRLVHGADHVGPSLEPRMSDALNFIGRLIAPPSWINEEVRQLKTAMDERRRQATTAASQNKHPQS